jgi:cell division protein ZapA (FtsZ GTPase activity inhibitor)
VNETVKVQLFGREYLLRSSGDAELLANAALLVEEKLGQVSTTISVDTRDRQMLAMLNLAGDYLQEKRKCLALKAEVETLQAQMGFTDEQACRLEDDLIARIEAALRT